MLINISLFINVNYGVLDKCRLNGTDRCFHLIQPTVASSIFKWLLEVDKRKRKLGLSLDKRLVQKKNCFGTVVPLKKSRPFTSIAISLFVNVSEFGHAHFKSPTLIRKTCSCSYSYTTKSFILLKGLQSGCILLPELKLL